MLRFVARASFLHFVVAGGPAHETAARDGRRHLGGKDDYFVRVSVIVSTLSFPS